MALGCPWFSPLMAWSCIVLSVFAVIILGVLSILFNAKHEELVGSINDPSPQIASEIAATIGTSILLYIATIVGCFFNLVFAKREARRGQIVLG